MVDVNLFVAFTAGLISFLAPCVVPLLPAYISYISGVSLQELTNSKNASHYKARVLLNSLSYVFGFSIIFVLLGLSATTLGRILVVNRLEIARIGGLIVIFFGVASLGVFDRFSFAQKEFKLTVPQNLQKIKYLGPFLLGNTFALAWTPCAGAILGAILTLAATSATVSQGALLLFVYSLGIALPFLLIALTIGQSSKLLYKLTPKLHLISQVGGVLLILTGILMVTQKFDIFNGILLNKLYQWDMYKNFQRSL